MGGDARVNKLKLTPEGKQELIAIKKQRAEYLNFMLQTLSRDSLKSLVLSFELIAKVTWEKMKDYKDNLSVT